MLCDFFENKTLKDTLQNTQTLIAAVSGGSDSLALLFLLKDYLKKYRLDINLLALTIDHQLRAESYQEALYVQELCQKNRIEHKILSWHGQKPKTGISQAARLARYSLISEEMHKHKVPLLCTGHTLNDQAETFLMRAKRSGSTLRGSACMAELSFLKKGQNLYPFCRPLLNCTREELRSYLREKNIVWVDDPSNESLYYERVRIRQALPTQNLKKINDEIKKAAFLRAQKSQRTACILEKLQPCFKNNLFSLTCKNIEDYYEDLPFLLKILSATVGGVFFPGGQNQESAFNQALERAQNTSFKFTFNRTVIKQRYNKGNWHCLMWREKRNLFPETINPYSQILWDRRFWIENKMDIPLMIRVPTFQEYKNFIQENNTYNKEALTSLFSLSSEKGIDIPLLKTLTAHKNSVLLTSNIAPFTWLISSHDLNLYKKLWNIFN